MTCLAGKQSVSWLPIHDDRANAAYLVRFAACPSRAQCTRSKSGRQRTLDTQERYTLLAQDAHQQTDVFKTQYQLRSGAESLISQAVREYDIRRTRYLCQARIHLQHVLTAVAI